MDSTLGSDEQQQKPHKYWILGTFFDIVVHGITQFPSKYFAPAEKKAMYKYSDKQIWNYHYK